MRFLLFICLALAIVGCEAPSKVKVDATRPAEMPTYSQLVAKHNERVDGIERFWARSIVEMRWTDEKGGKRLEQGEGHLILDLPAHSLMTIGKLGQTRLYAGSNETYFWLFDEMDQDKKTLYLGRHDGQAVEGLGPALQRSPLPLRPVDLPRLLGIVQIGTAGNTPVNAAQTVKWIDSRYVIEPPGERVRYHFSPISTRVERVDLLNEKGEVVLTSTLSQPERMDKTGAAVGPFMNTRIRVVTAGEDGSITLHLSGMTDEERKVNPKVFDLDAIRAARKPDVVIPVLPR